MIFYLVLISLSLSGTIQVCTKDTDEAEVATEFEELAKAFAEGAKASSPPLPLTVLVVQVTTTPHNFFLH